MPRRRKLLWLLIPLFLLLALPFPVVSALEEQDTFCIGCHTVPEETYYRRAQEVANGETLIPPDLASAHFGLPETEFRCINCHRGDDSFPHRWQTFVLGGKDTLVWLSGNADPAIEKVHAGEPNLLNAGCLKCHTDSLLELGFNNHFHNQLPVAATLPGLGFESVLPPEGNPGDLFTTLGESDTTITCLDCHHAHKSLTDGDLTLYLDVEEVVFPACVMCHEEVGHGPLELR